MWGRGWGGVGHVNVPCTLHTLLMFRNCQDVGQGLGMLTFLVRCTRCWCCATGRMWGRGWGGVGWGMLTFLVRCTRCWCSATARMWGRGWGMLTFLVRCKSRIVGKSTTVVYPDGNQAWESLCLAKKFEVEAVCHQRKKITRKTAQKASTRPCLAGTQMIDRAWRSLKFGWLPAHINATQKKDGHTVLSPIVSELVFQSHQGPMSPTQFFTALQRLLKHWKNGTTRRYADVPCKKCWWTNVSASCEKWPKRHVRLCGVYLVWFVFLVADNLLRFRQHSFIFLVAKTWLPRHSFGSMVSEACLPKHSLLCLVAEA